MKAVIINCFCFIALFASGQKGEEALRQSFEGMVGGFNAQDANLVIRSFSAESVLAYCGRADSGYDSIQASFKKMFETPVPTRRYSAEIKSLKVYGNLGYVHARWTVSWFSKKQDKTLEAFENDLEIWELKGSEWKLIRGMSCPAK